jgi:hypothetical protein
MAVLTIQLRDGNRGQAREAAGTKIPQTETDLPTTSDRAWRRVPALVFPQCSLGRGRREAALRPLRATGRWLKQRSSS